MVNGKRASGILMHITSLPSAYGIGDLGPQSYRFVDLLADAKQHYWSTLPLNPTRLQDGNSPYQTSSAFAGNYLLISPEKLLENKLLPKEQAKSATVRAASKVDFPAVYEKKALLLEKAFYAFKASESKLDFDEFCSKNSQWLNDYALYSALRQKSSKPWYMWVPSLRKREPKALERKRHALKDEIEREMFWQYLFFTQWFALKAYCNTKQVRIIGDMPFYVAYDSADVWANPEFFSLKPTGKPLFVGGVPPDYFSATGQLWGNPAYDWEKLRQTGFQWWTNRISHSLKLYDLLRLDHFRGFVAYWQINALAKTAKNGRWIKAPSKIFFEKLKTTFLNLPFIAEDLGYIDAPVRAAIRRLGVPGMRVLLFAFDGSPDNPHLPKNYPENSVAYSSTHDTNTAKGWFTQEATEQEQKNVFKLLGRKVPTKNICPGLIRLVFASCAELCIVPLQDVLCLGSQARMNNPSRPFNNWQWRVTPHQLGSSRLQELRDLTIQHGRV